MREALEKLDIGQTELANWLGVTDRSIRHYVKGERPMPPALGLLLEYLLERPEAKQWFVDHAANREPVANKPKASRAPRKPAEEDQKPEG